MTKNRFDSLIFHKTGIINSSFAQNSKRYFVPDNIHLVSMSADNQDITGCTTSEISGSSVALSYENAQVAAFGEFVERYVSACTNHESYFGSYEKLKNSIPVYNPNHFNFFQKSQYKKMHFPYKMVRESTDLHWVKGNEFHTNEEIYMPESIVYLLKRNSHLYFPSTSTGLACGSSRENAINSGFLEAVERNGFSKFWYLQNYIKRVKYSKDLVLETFGDDEDIQALYNNERVTFTIFDLTEYTLTPTFLVFLEFNNRDKSYFTMGCSSRFTIKEALVKAAMEAYQGLDYAIRVGDNKRDLENVENFRDVDLNETIVEFTDHYWFYNEFEEAKSLVPIFRDLENKSNDSFNHSFKSHNHVLHSMSDLSPKLHPKIYVFDLSLPEFVDLGFYTYKVFSPDLVMLTGEHRAPIIGYKCFKGKEIFLELPHFFP